MDPRETGWTTSLGLLLLRLGIGGFMALHGWGKVLMVVHGDFEHFGDPIGMGNTLSLILAAGAEFVCAILVMAGLSTRLAAAAVVFTMGVAAFVAHAAHPWTMEQGYLMYMAKQADSWASKEPALLYLIPFLALVFTGAGRFSLDAMVMPWWRARQAAKKAEAAAARA